jgi:hypothetical protein
MNHLSIEFQVLIAFLGFIAIVIIWWAIWRWIVEVIRFVFRINESIAHLETISKRLANIESAAKSDPNVKFFCDVCEKKWPVENLKQIQSGQTVCPNCLREMGSGQE